MTFVDGRRRYLIRRDWWLQPLLWLVGLVRDGNSYVAIEGERLIVRFGWLFHQTFPLSDIEDVAAMRWPWYYGLGWRANLRGLVGLVGSQRGVVGIRFARRQKVGVLPLLKLGCDRLAVSLRESDEMVSALRAGLESSRQGEASVR